MGAMMNEPVLSLDQAKAVVETKTAPRVTEDSIKAKIGQVTFYMHPTSTGATLTICVMELKNGFTFVGKAAPADPRNYDRGVGERYAYEDAFKQIWSHEGYVLREILSAESRLDTATLNR